MTQYRKGNGEVELFPEQRENEVFDYKPCWPLRLQRSLFDGASADAEEIRIVIDAAVVSRIQEVDEVNAGAQRPTADIKQLMMRPKPHLLKKEERIPPVKTAVSLSRAGVCCLATLILRWVFSSTGTAGSA